MDVWVSPVTRKDKIKNDYSSTCLGRPPSWAATCLLRPCYQCPDRHISTLNYLWSAGHMQWTDTFAWSRGCPFMTGTTVHTRHSQSSELIKQSDKKKIEVVWVCKKTTTWTCLQADNRYETTQENKTRKTEDKVYGYCGQRHERKMADGRRRWQRTIDDLCGDPRWWDRLRKRRRLIYFNLLLYLPLIITS